MDTIKREAQAVNVLLKQKCGDDLTGRCIEASDMLTERLTKLGYTCKSRQCFVMYANWCSCSDRCYDEHWYTEVITSEGLICADATMAQFRWAFNDVLPEVYVGEKPPYYLDEEPDKEEEIWDSIMYPS